MDGSYDVFHDPDPDLVQVVNKTIGHTNNEHQLDLSNADVRFVPEDDDNECQSKPLADECQPPKSGDHAVHVERQVHSAAHIEHQGRSAPHIEHQDYSTLHIERQDNSIPPVEPWAESARHIKHQDNSAAHCETDQQGRQQPLPICQSFNFQNRTIQPLQGLSPQRPASSSSGQKTAPHDLPS
ncbi:hypothetical protein L210DRAFT_935778 [Boletus edulis BED1]|uniref:Uncharacterized protein n=1 Tax=Boletus edulis BED1 TaxID=1328754 RepID=A0AAD4G856_BOLED|nr:hypothetical protein L210DRAFT_935778 [Boletus edulis BED1]